MNRRVPVLGIATVLIIGATYLQRPFMGVTPTASEPNRAAMAASAATGRAETARLVVYYEAQVAEVPTAGGLKFLAKLYLQRGRLSGDVQTYGQARAAIEKAMILAPKDTEVDVLLASVSASMHEFAQAAERAAAVVASSPDNTGALAVLGDAQLELGDYGGARQSYDHLATLEPDAAAALVRQARVAFLTGRVDDARRLAKKAKDQATASAFGDVGLAFYSTFQGQVEHDTGHYAKAERFYRQALVEAPDYYVALAGVARERAAQGDRAGAITLYRQSLAIVPQPDALAALADLHHLRHDVAGEHEAHETIKVIASLDAANQQVYNRSVTNYQADHSISLGDALRSAEAELTVRRDIYGYDTFAWALYKNHRYADAKQASVSALALGTPDARLLYHAGMIDVALGMDVAACDELREALRISPQFDPLQAHIARDALAATEQRLREKS